MPEKASGSEAHSSRRGPLGAGHKANLREQVSDGEDVYGSELLSTRVSDLAELKKTPPFYFRLVWFPF